MTLSSATQEITRSTFVATGAGTAVLLLVAALAVPVGTAGISMGFTDGEIPPLADQLVWASLAIMALGFVAGTFTAARMSGGFGWASAASMLACGVIALAVARPSLPFFAFFPTWCACYFVVAGFALRPRRSVDFAVRVAFMAVVVAAILMPSWNDLLLGMVVLPCSLGANGVVEMLSHRLVKSQGPTLV